ncbi:hypothetical protein [Agromyces albus]|uniref:hypothetical protein n=1 Tax=Agromyces albus TaxID=205332 RepID=UPI00277DBCCC|nr:hypothetical protein [Agromyces albus]MDQ0575270.1 hypothetical protein [Agromyces albus]
MASKTFLESVLGMGDGYVLDFSNASFTNFFRDVDVDTYMPPRNTWGFGDSKVNRMRALWKSGSDAEGTAEGSVDS